MSAKPLRHQYGQRDPNKAQYAGKAFDGGNISFGLNGSVFLTPLLSGNKLLMPLQCTNVFALTLADK